MRSVRSPSFNEKKGAFFLKCPSPVYPSAGWCAPDIFLLEGGEWIHVREPAGGCDKSQCGQRSLELGFVHDVKRFTVVSRWVCLLTIRVWLEECDKVMFVAYCLRHSDETCVICRVVRILQLVIPLCFEWHFLALRAKLGFGDKAYVQAFHRRSARKVFEAIVQLGGFFIKLGQKVALTRGVVPEPYVLAMKPLSEQVPPLSFEVVAAVFRQSTDISVDTAFKRIDPTPIGSASLAQVHRATLRLESLAYESRSGPCEVVAKIQYPGVDETFTADLNTTVFLSKMLSPHLHNSLKLEFLTHMGELDFRIEAESLIRAGNGTTCAGYSPGRVVIPQPVLSLTTPKTMVMDFIPGVSYQSRINTGLDAFAQMLGLSDAEELRTRYNQATGIREMGRSPSDSRNARAGDYSPNLIPGLASSCFKLQRHIQHFIPNYCASNKLNDILELLIQVHGHQMLIEGFVNIDPHPGNIILMPDGRVGLIDYGQCVKFTRLERVCIARTILALKAGNQGEIAASMRGFPPDGYLMRNDCDASVAKAATFAFDKFDMSPLRYRKGHSVVLNYEAFCKKHTELIVPPCLTLARRLTSLLLMSGLQIGTDISLCSRWSSLARETLEMDQKPNSTIRKRTAPIMERFRSTVACAGACGPILL